MSGDKRSSNKPSRRDLLKGGLAAGIGLGLPLRAFAATATSATCPVGYDPATSSLAGAPVMTQANPGGFAASAAEHKISIGYYEATSYAVGTTNTETRKLLTVDVGASTGAGIYHPVEVGTMASLNTITDIYVFNNATGKLLFWRKLSAGDTTPSSMFVIPPGIAASAPKLTVVARCAMHGLWSEQFDMASGALDYASTVATYNAAKTCGGSTLLRPYISYGATGGQGNLGVEHRPNAVKSGADGLIVFLGGDLNGNGKHTRISGSHYVMGAALYDQSGNLLSARSNLYSADNVFMFPALGLAAKSVTTVRLVVFDSQNGRFMSFLDL